MSSAMSNGMGDNGHFTVMKVSALAHAQTSGSIDVALNGTVPFSIDAWVKFNGLCSDSSILTQDGVFTFGIVGDELLFQIQGFNAVQSDPTVSALDDDTWHYVCATFDGGSVRLYIDGQFNTMQSVSGTGTTNQNPLDIARDLQGLVDSVRVYDTVLSSDTVLANMFNPPAMTSIAAWFDFTQAPPVDLGPNHLSIQLQGGAAMQVSTPALRLSRGAYARPIGQEHVNPGGHQTDSYTVQAWVYVDSALNPQQVVFSNTELRTDSGMALYLQASDSGFKVVSQRGANVLANELVSTDVVPLNKWTNIATTFDGTTLTVYVQGVASGSGGFGPIPLLQNDSDLIIGTGSAEHGDHDEVAFEGFIARVDVWDRALTPTEIANYMTSAPAPDANGMRAIYDFTTSPARNGVDTKPTALVAGARLSSQVTKTTSTPAPAPPPATGPFGALDEDLLARLGPGEEVGDLVGAHRSLLDMAMEDDVLRFAGAPEGQTRVREAWLDHLETAERDPGSTPLRYTLHRLDGERILVCHSVRHGAYIAYRGAAVDFDDCTWWWIRLVFVIVSGAIDALFALRCYLTRGAQNYILRIINNPRIMARIAVGTVSASVVFDILVMLNTEGFLVELFKLIVEVGFWTILRCAARLFLIFVGVGAADIIASLVATAALLIYTLTHRPASCSALPAVDLAAIKFNYDPTTLTDGLNLRRNYTKPVQVPEWTKGMSAAKDSPALYSIANVTGARVNIQAKFVINTNSSTTARIQATGGGLLGAIDPITIQFHNGVSSPEYVTIPLTHQTLTAGGIQRQDVTWTWSYQIGSGSWTTIGTSVHRIYTVLSIPTLPWLPTVGAANPQTPWTDVLDYACLWASGKKNAVDAATAVTQKVNGAIGLTYDTNAGASAYTQVYNASSRFLCSDFVGFLSGGGGPRIVNCTDCATIVSTFANMLGCALTERTMYPSSGGGFLCNEIIAIGATTWAYPFPPRNNFNYHEVGMTGASSGLNVFDACLQVDRSSDPWTWPGSGHTPILPTDMQFTTLPTPLPNPPPFPIATPFTAMTYRERLAQNSTGGIGSCVEQGPFPYTQNGRRVVV